MAIGTTKHPHVGRRVQIPAYCDLWMRGARFGTIERVIIGKGNYLDPRDPRGATHRPNRDGSTHRTPAQYENGAYSVVMPGHDAHKARVTMETLDDAGEVVAASTMPIEPKKGGVIWSREAVRNAAGPMPKQSRKKVKAAEPIAIASPEPARCESEPVAVAECVNAPEALSEAPTGENGNHGIISQFTAPVDIEVNSEPDPIAELAARVAALEAGLAALATPIAGEATEIVTPTALARPARPPAHERAIRAAWKHRREARLQRSIAADHMRMREQVQDELRETARREAKSREHLEIMRGNYAALARTMDATEESLRDAMAKRLAAAQRARRMVAQARLSAMFQRQRGDVLHAQLDKLRADMADPMQPERASDIAQLVRERDEARNAAAATDARNRQMQAALDTMAGQFEALASRVARAEAALRKAA